MPSRPGFTPAATEAANPSAPSAAWRRCAVPNISPRATARQLDAAARMRSVAQLIPGRGNFMRIMLGLLLAAPAAAPPAATDPRTVPTELLPAWQTKTREVFKQAIEIPSVHHRGET